MSERMRRFRCLLTGGCRYSPKDLKVFTSIKDNETCFINYCIKCGKPIVSIVGMDELFL